MENKRKILTSSRCWNLFRLDGEYSRCWMHFYTLSHSHAFSLSDFFFSYTTRLLFISFSSSYPSVSSFPLLFVSRRARERERVLTGTVRRSAASARAHTGDSRHRRTRAPNLFTHSPLAETLEEIDSLQSYRIYIKGEANNNIYTHIKFA